VRLIVLALLALPVWADMFTFGFLRGGTPAANYNYDAL